MRMAAMAFVVLDVISFPALMSANISVQLAPSISTAPVGTTVAWTATAEDSTDSAASFIYQFSVGSSATTLQIRRDFSNVNQFPWTESDQEGTYDVQVVAKEESSGSTATTAQTFAITSLVTGSSPVASPSGHPLVALYSAPSCPAGANMQVQFRRTVGDYWWATALKPCNGSTSMNFYVGGMRPSFQYILEGYVYNGNNTTTLPPVTFNAGTIPSNITVENFNISQPEQITDYPITLTSPTQGIPFATDSVNTIMWYLPAYQNTGGYLTNPVPGGTFLGVADDSSGVPGNRRLMREYDLAGNLVRETNAAAISAQLTAMGTDPITSIHHEAFRFPNGDTGIIGSVEKIANQGDGPVDVLGDMAIVLDPNLQVKFFWNEFDHLNIMNQAVLHETCQLGNAGCPILYQPGYTVANDWTHSNSLAPTPDGNLIISIRHQDEVIKIAYNNGLGDGHIIWRLGRDHNFSVQSNDPYPWFTHQHDVTYAPNGLLTLFDNGNTRVAEYGGNSRGQSWQLDEVNMVATPVLNLDMGVFSMATGSAELLSNGDYHFFLGFINNDSSQTVEVTPGGSYQFQEVAPNNVGYRSFRMRTLYTEF
jgi:arylsulfate sulfotransferase